MVQGDPVKVNSEGVSTSVYFRQKQTMANTYGEETGKVLSFLTSVYGLAPQANLTLVETEDGTPNGYSAPGIIFLSPRGIGNQFAARLVANQLARQWWETLYRPSTAIICGLKTATRATPSCCGTNTPTVQERWIRTCTTPTSKP